MLIDMNYKEIDTQRIIDYIGTFANGVSVDDIILHSGILSSTAEHTPRWHATNAATVRASMR
mgnify:CR=1 FL=1